MDLGGASSGAARSADAESSVVLTSGGQEVQRLFRVVDVQDPEVLAPIVFSCI